MNKPIRCLLALALALAACWAGAAEFPAQPITIVVPFPAGGGTDVMARKIGEQLRVDLGQPVLVDNKAGAGGNIGATQVARAKPDGYTLLLTAAPFAIAPAMYKNLPFDPVKDFTPITQVATVPLLLVVRPDSPLNTVADLIALAKKTDGKVNFASFGNGSPPHLVGESIKLLAKVKMTHVPYKGGMAAVTDILSGQIDVGILDAVSTTPFVKSGQLKALAITGPKRSPALPNLPTLSQSGVGFDQVGWHALFGPAGMPPALVARINTAVNKILAAPAMREFIVQGGSIPVEPAMTPAQWAAQFRTDVRVWGEVVRDSGATIE